MNKNLQVGLIGFGMGGQLFHAPIISAVDGLTLKKIRASRPEQIAIARARYPNAALVADAEEIILDPEIDLVVITTPNEFHAPLARAALLSGKHVVIDKPFTISTEDADELIALANKQDKIISVFQSRRFDSDFRTVLQVIGSGLLGRIVEVESRYDRFRNFLRPGSWKEKDIPGSGILYDLGSHLIDQALTLYGLPQTVTAFIDRQRSGSLIDDHFEVILQYPEIKFTLKSGMLVREPLQRFVLFGSEGIYIKKGMDVQEEALKAGIDPRSRADWGHEPRELWGSLHSNTHGLAIHGKIESLPGDYRIYYKNIYESIQGKEELLVTATQARNVIRIIELAKQSQGEKRTIAFA
jgi:scyllo-inositol 2-dehydrogenase (NADP+)